MRLVVDANVFVSALISPQGTAGALVRRLVEDDRATFIVSRETMDELKHTLSYPKIQKLLKQSPRDLERFLASVEMLSEQVDETLSVAGLECRDPDDLKYLFIAVVGRAECLVSGDKDLLVLGNVEGIPIVTPVQLLTQITG